MATIAVTSETGTLRVICSTMRWMCWPRIVRTRSDGARWDSSISRMRSEPRRYESENVTCPFCTSRISVLPPPTSTTSTLPSLRPGSLSTTPWAAM